MNKTAEAQILESEERLRLAMLASDVGVLDEMLAPELIFTNHLGQLISKQDDLAAHASGMLEVKEMKLSERHIQLHGEIAVVSVRTQLSGTYGGNPANGDFRFTRVWSRAAEGVWRVTAAHACMVA